MERIDLSFDEYLLYNQLKPNFIGNEGKLYRKGKEELHKLYIRPWEYSSKRVETLSERQSQIIHTQMPVKTIFYEDIFLGIVSKYFTSHKKLIRLKKAPIEVIIMLLQNLRTILEELTDNFIYLTDLDDENILVSPTYKLEAIDLDGLDTIVCDSFNKEEFQSVLSLYKNIILDFLYPKYDGVLCPKNPVAHLEKAGLPVEFIKPLIVGNINYELLNELIEKTYKDKIYLKK